MSITVYDGPPGVGKTSKIIEDAPTLQGRTAIVTFTREAAHTVLTRSPGLTAGTIYSLTWPLVRQYGLRSAGKVITAAYMNRPVRGEFDPALDQYSSTAPSARPRQRSDEQAEALHAWDGAGAPPFDVHGPSHARGSLAYLLPLARWLVDGRPGLTDEARYDTVFVDEAQDMGALEMAVASALARPGGSLVCYGDPGQALYAEAKGLRGGVLPAAWRVGGSRQVLTGGHRCGDPLASLASRVLRPIWDRPASTFRAAHETRVEEWAPALSDRFGQADLVLGYSRADATRFVKEHGLRSVALVPSARARARLTVCTGHAAKGAQADDVYLLPWSRIGMGRLYAGEPGAIRLLYTMLTRAKRRVFVPPSLLAFMGA